MADSWHVNDGQELLDIVRNNFVEQTLIALLQGSQVTVLVKIAGHPTYVDQCPVDLQGKTVYTPLHRCQYAEVTMISQNTASEESRATGLHLNILGEYSWWQQTTQIQPVPFVLCESQALVVLRVASQVCPRNDTEDNSFELDPVPHNTQSASVGTVCE